jgi:hypothetical protein
VPARNHAALHAELRRFLEALALPPWAAAALQPPPPDAAGVGAPPRVFAAAVLLV